MADNVMSPEEYEKLLSRLEGSELYRKSSSVHKGFQYRQFYDSASGRMMEGRQVREEDLNGRTAGEEGFDGTCTRTVIYTFRNGVLQSENGEPAVQYPGHYEIWNTGLLVKVVSDGGDREEYWENGVPVRIEENLSERRRNGEDI